MANLLGWKDILRPIRDGYRHLFPAPDTGPTPEERRKQRELDRLKGFTYFDTVDQIEAWTEAEADPLQRANTPLLPRYREQAENEPNKANVLLIHDYAGNYHEYESVQEVGIDEEKYTCEYLQYVDTFIYFSHKLVCVPPPTWTNTLHRNGVESLGTLLIEPQTEGSEKLLQHTNIENVMTFPMAKKLADIAVHYGFDGWLVNIEKPFPKETWDVNVLEIFLNQLKGELGETSRLIWYDALTTTNKVAYQNALNTSNFPFAKACGNILTNYCWTEAGVESSRQLASRNEIPLRNIFFGIDVWAQNTTKLTHPRVTYPEKGGGGTNTGVAVVKLAELGFSAGIFAPAWSFEHFPGQGRAIERAVWEGTALPEGTECSCGNCTTRHQPNLVSPIIRSAREFAAGSESFFYTDFCCAFGTHSDKEKEVFGDHGMHAQLGAQSILPRPLMSKEGDPTIILSHRLEDVASRKQLVIEARQLSSTNLDLEHWLPLYKLNMLANGSLQLRVRCRNLLRSTRGAVVSLYARSTNGVQLLDISENNGIQTVYMTVGRTSHPSVRLQELGVHVLGSLVFGEESVPLLEVLEICIAPQSTSQASQFCSIDRIRLENHSEGESKHTRLCWSYHDKGSAEPRARGVPYSKITGPFSYFLVRVDGLELARAYALEHILSQGLLDRVVGREVEVEIVGVGFDGRTLDRRNTTLRLL